MVIAMMALTFPPALVGAEDGDTGVGVLFDFGEGRWAWAEVQLPDPANAWCATVDAAEGLGFELDYSFSQFGVFLEGVDDVTTPMDFIQYWGLWSWNAAGTMWEASMVGALDVSVENGSVLAWSFGPFGAPAPDPNPVTREPFLEFRGGRDVPGRAGPQGPSAGGLFWERDMENGPIDSTVAVADGKVFGITAGIFDWNLFEFTELPTVFALDIETGDLVWEYEFRGSGGFEIGSPAYHGGSLFVTTSGRSVLALDADDGTLEWETSVDDIGLSSSPTIAGGKVLVGTGSGNLVALEASNGEVNWTATLSGWVYLQTPTVHDGVVYVGTDNGTLHAVSLEDGTEVWSTELGGRLRGTTLALDDRIYVISAIYPGFVATEGFLHALDPEGKELWNISIGPTGSSPAMADDLVVGGAKSGLWAVRSDGTVAWRYEEQGQISASPIVAGDRIFVMSNENDTLLDLHTAVIALDMDGTAVWSRVLEPHNWALSSVSIADGRAYVATDSGLVYALGETPLVAQFEFAVDGLKVDLNANETAIGVLVDDWFWSIEGPDVNLEGKVVDFEFKKAGDYLVTLTIVDEFGREASRTVTVSVEKDDVKEGSPGLGPAAAASAFIVAALLMVAMTRRKRR
jgi:outer membrane protein assembly factor BamB